jgi:uncharacterized repeat protein (TIGR01451 family)
MTLARRVLFTVGLLLALLIPAVRVQAANFTFTVNSSLDLPDALPGDGFCAAAGGACTLRAAVQEADAGPPAATLAITLPAGLFALTIPPAGGDDVATGDLNITRPLTITGAGQLTTIVDGGALDRIFNINTAGAVGISGLTVQNGAVSANSAVAGGFGGGGILVQGSAAVTFSNMAVSSNSVATTGTLSSMGGGIRTVGTGSLTLTAVTISGNTMTSGQTAVGGGLQESGGGTVTLTNCTVSGNTVTALVAVGGGVAEGGFFVELGSASFILTATTVSGNSLFSVGGGFEGAAFGGGIAQTGGGAVTLLGSMVSGNSATETGGAQAFGGGIVQIGEANVAASGSTIGGNTVTSNSGPGEGGGIAQEGSGNVTLTDSVVSGNTAQTNGPAGRANAFGGGIVEDAAGIVTLANVTISGNRAVSTTTARAGGGGVGESGGGQVVMTNVTVDGNTATSNGGAAQGGGLSELGGAITVLNGTISNTGAGSGGNLSRTVGEGASSIALKNTIVAYPVSGGNCAGTLTSSGSNLSSDGSCAAAFVAPGDQNNKDPLLGPLQNNGGLTPTRALPPISPAVDAVVFGCPPPPTDQRGTIRPQGTACDVGAYELVQAPQAVVPPSGPLATLDLQITKTGPATATAGQNYSYTLAVTNLGSLTAPGATVTDTLPAGLTVVSATATTGSCTAAGSTVTCQLGTVGPSQVVGITLTVTPTTPGSITNTASVSTSGTDVNPANNTASAATQVSVPQQQFVLVGTANTVLVIIQGCGGTQPGPAPALNPAAVPVALAFGSSVNLQPVPCAGWVFSGWSGSGTACDGHSFTPCNIAAPGPPSITAVFIKR